MDVILWKDDLPPIKHDPRGVEHYRMNWTKWLDGESISAISVTGEGITAMDITNVLTPAGSVDFRVTGGAVNQAGTATVTVSTASGRQQPRSLRFIGVLR